MIFNSIRYNSDSYVNEAEFDEILEFAPNRFEYETLGEATAIVIGEQEVNWGRLMVGVGMSELHSVQEGLEFVNEAGRLKGFFDKVIAFFKMAINKLAEITKAFIAKIDQFIKSNDGFIKKYEKQITNAEAAVIAGIEFKGYKFNHNKLKENPSYTVPKNANLSVENAKTIASNEGSTMTPYLAKKSLIDGSKDYTSENDNFSEAVTKYLFGGEKEEFKLDKPMVLEALGYIKETKNLKKTAKNSYTSAAKQLKDIIKRLENASGRIDKEHSDLSNEDRAKVEKGYKITIDYWKAYSQGCQTYHGTLMRALSTRNSQSKAMCVKVVQKLVKGKGQEERNKMRKRAGMDEKDYSESYISTDAFLGAVEFI